MKRTILIAALASVAALWLGCPHDLSRRQWPDVQVPPDRGVDLARDLAQDLAAPDLVDALPGEGSDLETKPDLGCLSCVSTLVGKGIPGSNSKTVPLSQAEFTKPQDVAVDAWGNVFVADTGNHVIRQISGGQVSLLAGAVNKAAFADGTGTAARFFTPMGIAVDKNGVVYVADLDNNRIRMIVKGVVSTVAGSTISGYVDGTVSVARFKYPSGVTVDASGDKIYVADSGNNRIRVIEKGYVSTFAGNNIQCAHLDGSALVAQFCTPNDVAAQNGKVHVVEDGNFVRLIWKGMVSSVAGQQSKGYKNGTGAQVLFNRPNGLAMDLSGDVLVADKNNHAIRRVTAAGVVTTLAGNGWGGLLNGPGQTAQFNTPTGVAVDSKGVIYVADSQNHSIRIIK